MVSSFANPPTQNKLDPDVEREYQNRYEKFPDRYELRSEIDRASEESGRQNERDVRIDARYLLLMNFTEMVIRPIDGAQKVPVAALRDAALDDIRNLIRDAATKSETEQISGHQVLNALTAVWADLRTTGYNLWD